MKKTEVKGIITAHETKALRNNAKASVTAVNKAKREYFEQNYGMQHMSTYNYDDIKAIEYRYAARRREIIEEYEKLYSILKTNTAADTYDYIVNTVGMDPSLTGYKAPEKFEIAPTAVRSDLLGVD